MQDSLGRTIDYMRVSVTDRCNLRCVYCMPREGIACLSHDDVLSYEEIHRVVKEAAALGISKIKITGGEPLVRKNVAALVRMVKDTPGISAVTMTTNGVLFPQFGRELAEAGLCGVNFSLDSLDAATFKKLTLADAVDSVKAGIALALKLGLKTKLNCVPIAGYNSGDWVNIARLAQHQPLDVRFIELMPIGLGRGFQSVPGDAILEQLTASFGQPSPSAAVHGNGPAVYVDFPGFTGSIGFISALSHSFCAGCNRVRLTADGELKPCLCSGDGLDLKPLLREGASDEALRQAIERTVAGKPGRHHMCENENSEKRKMVQIGG